MHLIIAPLAVACDRVRDPSWKRIGTGDPALMRLFGLQISILLAAAVAVAWVIGTHFPDLRLRYWMIAAAAVLVAPLHELVHALAFPRGANAQQPALHLWPREFVLCAQYRGAVSRNRYVLVLLMPLLTLSLAPMLACAAFDIGGVPPLCIVLFVLNALASGDDVLAAVLVLSQVPAGGLVRSEGSVTLWKPAAPPAGTRTAAG